MNVMLAKDITLCYNSGDKKRDDSPVFFLHSNLLAGGDAGLSRLPSIFFSLIALTKKRSFPRTWATRPCAFFYWARKEAVC